MVLIDDNSKTVRLTRADHRLLEFPIGQQLIQLIESDIETVSTFLKKYDIERLLKLIKEGQERGFSEESEYVKGLFLEILNRMHPYFGNSVEIVESDIIFLRNIQDNIFYLIEIINLFLMKETHDSIKSLTTSQKLYLLNLNWGLFFNDFDISFKVSFFSTAKTQYFEDYKHDIGKMAIDKIIEVANRIKDMDFETCQIYECDVLKLCYLEIVKMITLGIVVGKCQNCGRYFIVTGRSDTEYCDRIAPGYTDKTCKDVGPLKDYKNRIEGNPLLLAYQKTYKAKHAELRKITNPIKYEEEKEKLKQWRISAKDSAEKGEILDEFRKWLKQ